MALNEKNPPVITNLPLIGIDLELQKLALKLSTIPWLAKSWGRAKTINGVLIKSKTNEPMVYLSKTEYYTVLPNDSFNAYSFWGVSSPEKSMDQSNTVQTSILMETQVYCIIWCNLRQINKLRDYIYTQELVLDVLKSLKSCANFTLSQVIDEKVEDIFKGYTLNPTQRDLLMYPYQAFRVEGYLNYILNLC